MCFKSEKEEADYSLSTRGFLHNCFHGQTCKTSRKDLNPSTPSATPALSRGPGKGAGGENVSQQPFSRATRRNPPACGQAAQESMDQNRWLEGVEEVLPW